MSLGCYMSFNKEKIFVNDSYIRQILLKVREDTVNVFEDISDTASEILKKLNCTIPTYDSKDIIKQIQKFMTNDNCNLINAMLNLNREHIISVLYLVAEKRISSSNELIEIITGDSYNTITNLILKKISSEKFGEINLFGSLYDYIKKRTGYDNIYELASRDRNIDDVVKENNSLKLPIINRKFTRLNYVMSRYGKNNILMYADNLGPLEDLSTGFDNIKLIMKNNNISITEIKKQFSDSNEFGQYSTNIEYHYYNDKDNKITNLSPIEYLDNYDFISTIINSLKNKEYRYITNNSDYRNRKNIGVNTILRDAYANILVDYSIECFKTRSGEKKVEINKDGINGIIEESLITRFNDSILNDPEWKRNINTPSKTSIKNVYTVMNKFINEDDSEIFYNRTRGEFDSNGKYKILYEPYTKTQKINFSNTSTLLCDIPEYGIKLDVGQDKLGIFCINNFSTFTNVKVNDSGEYISQETLSTNMYFIGNLMQHQDIMRYLISNSMSTSTIINSNLYHFPKFSNEFKDICGFDILLSDNKKIVNFGTFNIRKEIEYLLKFAEINQTYAVEDIANNPEIASGIISNLRNLSPKVYEGNKKTLFIVRDIVIDYLRFLNDSNRTVLDISISDLGFKFYKLIYLIRMSILNIKEVKYLVDNNQNANIVMNDLFGDKSSIEKIKKEAEICRKNNSAVKDIEAQCKTTVIELLNNILYS